MRPSSNHRTKTVRTARDSPSSIVNRSRSQSHIAPEPSDLVADLPPVLLFPRPHTLDEPLATQLLAVEPLLRQLTLDDVLGGDPRMVGAGEEEDLSALKLRPARAYRSMCVCPKAVPMCSAPVTFGGGMTSDHGSLSVLGSAWK